MSTPTPEQIKAYVELHRAVADAVKELGKVPEGILYAHLMGIMDLDRFNRIIQTLVNSGVIERKPGNFLVWRAPK